jgi:hypothetical protein
MAAELITTSALFPGDSEVQQLLHIFKYSTAPCPLLFFLADISRVHLSDVDGVFLF